MNRLAWIAVAALAGIGSFVVSDLLNPEPVPVAPAVELTGAPPPERPTPEGFFVVPPRVVDFRNDGDDVGESSGPADGSSAEEGSDDRVDAGDADERDDEDQDDDSPDDSADDLDDEDDSIDDDD